MRSAAIFDLDGVLVDSREAVRRAYRKVGIEMPLGAWGKPWQEWLPQACGGDPHLAKRVHDMKTLEYATNGVYDVRPLPPLDLMHRLDVDGIARVGVITGASRDAAAALQRIYFPEITVYGTNCAWPEKAELLDTMLWFAENVAYVDDDPPGEVAGVNVIRYDEETDLEKELEYLWTP